MQETRSAVTKEAALSRRAYDWPMEKERGKTVPRDRMPHSTGNCRPMRLQMYIESMPKNIITQVCEDRRVALNPFRMASNVSADRLPRISRAFSIALFFESSST